MNSTYEVLARERMREQRHLSREAAVTRSLARRRRWHRVSLHASAAESRHAHRLRQYSVR